MKKRLLPFFLTLPLLLISCATGGSEESNSDNSAKASSSTSPAAAELPDDGSTLAGEIGKQHGYDCQSVGDCSILFTMESMEIPDQCDGHVMGEPPADTHLVKATILLEANPSQTRYLQTEFPIWTDWSALTSEGINQDLQDSSWCYNTNPGERWQNEIQVGDTERRIQYLDIPDGATKIRLTEILDGGRWEFPAPATATATAETARAQDSAAPAPVPSAEAPAPQPTVPVATQAPAQDPVTAPSPAPVIGFTGAPSVETPRVLDKQIASCGDPSLHQTGTTFFTDGTSGWTEACSSQMMP